MRGGQVSVEYLIITAFSFLLLAPLLIIFYVQYDSLQEEVVNQQAVTAARVLVEAAERVYFAGSPSRETVQVRIPAQVQSFRIYEDAVALTIERGLPKDVVRFTEDIFVEDHPPLATHQGVRRFTVRATIDGVIIEE